MTNVSAAILPTARALAFAVVYICASIWSAASEEATPVEDEINRPIKVADARGKEIKVRLPIARVVSLSWDGAEVLRAIGCADLIVGITDKMARYKEFWPDLARLPQVGSPYAPNVEALAVLHPDLVIAYASRPDEEFERKMALFGVQVLRLECFRPEAIRDDIRTLGRILGKEDKAEVFAQYIAHYHDLLCKRIASIPPQCRPNVYMEGYGDYIGDGEGTAAHALCLLAGGQNITALLAGQHPRISTEWLLVQQPRFIVKALNRAMWGGGFLQQTPESMARALAAIKERSGWSDLEAIKNNHILLCTSDVWAGPAYFVAALKLAKTFHPDLFADIDPDEILKDYLQRFHGLEKTGTPFFP